MKRPVLLLAGAALLAAGACFAGAVDPTGLYFRALRDNGTRLYALQFSSGVTLSLGQRDLVTMTPLSGRMALAAKWQPPNIPGDREPEWREVLGARIFFNCTGAPVADRAVEVLVDVGHTVRVTKTNFFPVPLRTGVLLGKDVFPGPEWPASMALDLGRPGEDRADETRRIEVRQRVSIAPGEGHAIAVRTSRSARHTRFDVAFAPADDALTSVTFTRKGTVCLHHMVLRGGNYVEETECFRSGDKAELRPSPPNAGETSDSDVAKISVDGPAVAHLYKGKSFSGDRDTFRETKEYDTGARAFTWQAVRAPQYKSIRVEDNATETKAMAWRDVRRALPEGAEVYLLSNAIDYSVTRGVEIARYAVDATLAAAACRSAGGWVEQWLTPEEYEAHRNARRLVPPPRGLRPNEWHAP